jgi:hypothetical protein
MRRIVLRLFFVSVALNAALAIYAVLAGAFGDVEGNILFTSLCVTGAAILVIGCETARERRRLGPLPRLGQAAAVAGFSLLVITIWVEPEGDALPRAAGTLITVACAAALLSLLTLAALAPRFRWTFTATTALAGALTVLLILSLWGLFEDSGWFIRLLGVVAVLLAAFVVVVPVLHRLSGKELPEGAGERALAATISFCPSCGAPVSARAGVETSCTRCGAVFTVLLGRG